MRRLQQLYLELYYYCYYYEVFFLLLLLLLLLLSLKDIHEFDEPRLLFTWFNVNSAGRYDQYF